MVAATSIKKKCRRRIFGASSEFVWGDAQVSFLKKNQLSAILFQVKSSCSCTSDDASDCERNHLATYHAFSRHVFMIRKPPIFYHHSLEIFLTELCVIVASNTNGITSPASNFFNSVDYAVTLGNFEPFFRPSFPCKITCNNTS